jgi:hypothetical protein
MFSRYEGVVTGYHIGVAMCLCFFLFYCRSTACVEDILHVPIRLHVVQENLTSTFYKLNMAVTPDGDQVF